MPLIKPKSKKAMPENSAEMDAGKPSLAIALAAKRNVKRKNMAFGGKAENDMAPNMSPIKESYDAPAESEYMADEDEHYSNIADAILAKKRQAKNMAEGGIADIQENGEEEGSTSFDEQNMEAIKKELYDDDQISSQPLDSKGDSDNDDDKMDMISSIRRKMKSKRG